MNHIQSFYSKALFYINKTSLEMAGHQKFTRLSISTLKLFQEIFSSYKEVLQPIIEDLNEYKNFCYALLIFPCLNKIIKTKKMNLANISYLFISVSLSAKYLQSIHVIGKTLKTSTIKVIEEPLVASSTFVFKNFILKHLNSICIGFDAAYILVSFSAKVIKAKNSKERKEILSSENRLLLINRMAKLVIAGIRMSGWQVPLALAAIDFGACVANYSRFLIKN